jgi:NADPH:quinone reductase-like Zn-dependent oxidoreductase
MRQVWISKAGPPEVLEVREAPDPEPKAGEVRIRTRACGINFADLVARTGMYRDAPPIPCVIGYEVSGTVDKIGEGVANVAVGDRVFGMPKFGGYTDTLVLPADQAVKMPAKMTFEEAAALPVVYLTAHHAMLYTGSLHKGMKILIHSAAGGVGLAAVQLARVRGCEIYGTASPSKHEFLKAEGVAHTIDSTGDVPQQARALIGERGFDLILNAIGGRSWKDDDALLGPAGRLVCFGISTMTPGKKKSIFAALGMLFGLKWWNAIGLMMKNRSVTGINMAELFARLDIVIPQFEALVAMYERGEIKPHVDRTFPFSDAAAAHHWLHDRKAKGKVLLTPT